MSARYDSQPYLSAEQLDSVHDVQEHEMGVAHHGVADPADVADKARVLFDDGNEFYADAYADSPSDSDSEDDIGGVIHPPRTLSDMAKFVFAAFVEPFVKGIMIGVGLCSVHYWLIMKRR